MQGVSGFRDKDFIVFFGNTPEKMHKAQMPQLPLVRIVVLELHTVYQKNIPLAERILPVFIGEITLAAHSIDQQIGGQLFPLGVVGGIGFQLAHFLDKGEMEPVNNAGCNRDNVGIRRPVIGSVWGA